MVARGSLAPMEEGLLAATASVLMAQAAVVASPAGVSPVPPVQAEKVLVAAVWELEETPVVQLVSPVAAVVAAVLEETPPAAEQQASLVIAGEEPAEKMVWVAGVE